MSSPAEALPVIDVAPLLGAKTPGRSALEPLRALHRACTGPGFFYVRNHGVSAREERRLFALSRSFFSLALEHKLAIENVHSPHFRGFTRVGHELTAGAPDLREQLDIGAEKLRSEPRDSDPLFLRLRGPNQWPAELPELKPALLSWSSALDRVAVALLRGLAQILGQPAECFDRWFLPEPDSHLKVIRYPGQPAPGAQGVGWHKDYGFLALVLQDEQGGLEVELDGEPRVVPPLPGALVTNLGEMFEVATAGYFRATRHRVVSPVAPAERLSLAHFFSPKLEAVLGELPLPPELARQRRPRELEPDNPIFAEFGRNSLRGWVRSHPEVARRHYPELSLE
jgi:isopenicillin N synthase-like dioxygenase